MSKDINYEIGLANDKLVLSEKIITDIRKILRNTNSLKWNTTAQISRSMRYILNMRRSWLMMRESFLVSRLAVRAMMSTMDGMNQMPEDYHLTRSRNQDGTNAVKAIAFGGSIIYAELFSKVHRLMKRWYDLCLTLDVFYEQAQKLCLQIPPYMAIKKKLPINGRLAYSCIMACENGRLSRTLSHQNQLFGWSYSYPNVVTNLQKISRVIGGGKRVEKGGPCPSLLSGRNILNSQRCESIDKPSNSAIYSTQTRSEIIHYRYRDDVLAHSLCGLPGSSSPTLLKFIRWPERVLPHEASQGLDRTKLRIWAKMVQKIMGVASRSSNQVLTVMTGPPQHLIGDDYYAPCLYTEEATRKANPNASDIINSIRRVARTGYILLRRGWPDMVHVPYLEFLANEVSEKLDRASLAYFTRIRSEAENKLTHKQRIARMLRRLRAFFLDIDRNVSYNAGNCKPGTAQFISRLQLLSANPDREWISGPELAKCWRKAKYPEVDRLDNVIIGMLRKQAIQIALADHAAAWFFPVEIESQLAVDTAGTVVDVAAGTVEADPQVCTEQPLTEDGDRYEPFPPAVFGMRPDHTTDPANGIIGVSSLD